MFILPLPIFGSIFVFVNLSVIHFICVWPLGPGLVSSEEAARPLPAIKVSGQSAPLDMVTTRNWPICGPGKSCAAGWGRLGGQEEGTSGQCSNSPLCCWTSATNAQAVLLEDQQCYKWMVGGSEGLERGHRWRNVIKAEERKPLWAFTKKEPLLIFSPRKSPFSYFLLIWPKGGQLSHDGTSQFPSSKLTCTKIIPLELMLSYVLAFFAGPLPAIVSVMLTNGGVFPSSRRSIRRTSCLLMLRVISWPFLLLHCPQLSPSGSPMVRFLPRH